MVTAYTQEHVYEHPWERVTSAVWRKFTDPDPARALSHILDVETLQRRLDPTSGLLQTTRSITVHGPAPWVLRRLLGLRDLHCLCVESTVVDPVSRTMVIATRNISLRHLLDVEEVSSYSPHPDRPLRWTSFRQHTRIHCKPLSALASIADKVEHRCADRFLSNSLKGRHVLENICKYLESNPSSDLNL